MMTAKAVITVGKPVRDDGEDIVKLTLHPRVDNYAEVASAIEAFFSDRGAFKACRHAAGSDVWEVILVEGTRLEGVHDALAGGLNTRADVPGNVVAVPEGAIPAFDEDDNPLEAEMLRAVHAQLKDMTEQSKALTKRLESLVVVIEAALEGGD